jgi:hypothetical protein
MAATGDRIDRDAGRHPVPDSAVAKGPCSDLGRPMDPPGPPGASPVACQPARLFTSLGETGAVTAHELATDELFWGINPGNSGLEGPPIPSRERTREQHRRAA